MPAADATAPLTPGFGTPPVMPAGGPPPHLMPGADLEATLPLMPAVGIPSGGVPFVGQPPASIQPGGWPPADPMGPPPWAQGQPPYAPALYRQDPYGQAPYGQSGYGQVPDHGAFGPASYGTPAGGTPVPPYAGDDGWGPEDGPQAGTAYGTRPPAPPSGIRRGAAGGGGGRGPSAVLIGSVIGVAAILAVAVWFLMFRPSGETASGTPTPGATTFVTPPPTATPEAYFSFDPSPEPTRFRNPTFAGLRVADARSLADRSGVRIEVTYEVTDEVDPETVIDQDPGPGEELLPGDVVRLTVAAPAPTVAVPDLRGFSEDDAIAALLDSGLGIGERLEAYDVATAAGQIIRTDPRGGISVARETLIDYVVSLGPEPSPSTTPAPTELPAPGLVGLTVDDAQVVADEWGIVLDVREAETLDAEPGTVLSQDPPADTAILPGSTVVIVVAVQPATVVVPDVRDLLEDDAISALLDAGLAPGGRTEAFSEDIDAGSIIRTDPRQGVAVAPGTVVDYLVSLGAEPTPTPSATAELVAVPDLSGLPIAEAEAAVEAAGLVLETEDRETLEVEPGIVLAQDPPLDTLLPAGSTVRVAVSVRPSAIAVPALRGLSEADAVAALEAASLVPGERGERWWHDRRSRHDRGLRRLARPRADPQPLADARPGRPAGAVGRGAR
jgi:beta-lactam-binding protein with PASTA domain